MIGNIQNSISQSWATFRETCPVAYQSLKVVTCGTVALVGAYSIYNVFQETLLSPEATPSSTSFDRIYNGLMHVEQTKEESYTRFPLVFTNLFLTAMNLIAIPHRAPDVLARLRNYQRLCGFIETSAVMSIGHVLLTAMQYLYENHTNLFSLSLGVNAAYLYSKIEPGGAYNRIQADFYNIRQPAAVPVQLANHIPLDDYRRERNALFRQARRDKPGTTLVEFLGSQIALELAKERPDQWLLDRMIYNSDLLIGGGAGGEVDEGSFEGYYGLAGAFLGNRPPPGQ